MSAFANEVIVVTGAANGIGRVLTRRLCEQGAAIAAIDRDAEGLRKLQQDLAGRRLACAVADVTDAAGLKTAIDGLESQLGPIDRLIANAGIGKPTPATGPFAADFEEIIRVNLIGVSNSVAAVLPGMIARRKGHLVAMSSVASFRGVPYMSAYCAAKAGINALFDSLAVELKPLGIQVSTICPSWIRTALTGQITFKMHGIIDVEPAVDYIVAAIRKKKRFKAFPFRMATMLKILRMLPPALVDRLIGTLLK